MYAPGGFDDLHAGTQVEVIGVGQDDPGAGFVAHVAVEDALDRGRRAHGHEDRGIDRAVVGFEPPDAGGACGVGMSDREFHCICWGYALSA